MGKASRKKQKVNLQVVNNNNNPKSYFEKQVAAGDYGKSTPSGRRFSKNIEARTENQAAAIDMLRNKTFSFISGTWGTGKAFLAVAIGVEMLKSGAIKKLVIMRSGLSTWGRCACP